MKNSEKSSKLQQFEATLTELEEQAGLLKKTSRAFAKLEELVVDYEQITKSLGESKAVLLEISSEQEERHTAIQSLLGEIKFNNSEDYKKIVKAINNQNEQIKKDVSSLSINLDSEVKRIGVSITESIDKLRSENKSFYLDFEKTLKIKLGENKSEIQRLIEHERTQIKSIIELEINKQTKDITSNQGKTHNLIIGFGILVAILVIVSFFV